MKKKVMVAMSGGVDSSVAAALLVRQGYAVEGVTMDLSIPEKSAQAVQDARKVCESLHIPHRVIQCSPEFETTVVQYFIREYTRGHTPNPCVYCNRDIKFGLLLQTALHHGCDFFATGHYAHIVQTDKGYLIKRPKDRTKDQTYFLYAIQKDFLPSILFPLAEYTKDEVRSLARTEGLAVADKAQSQDICFIPDKEYSTFIRQQVRGIRPGRIVDRQGKVLGTHQGIMFYTIGQRGGLGISAKAPLYVVELNAEKNEIVVGEKQSLRANGLIADLKNTFVTPFPERVYAKIRYAHPQTLCSVQIEASNKLQVIFDEPQESITPGQSVVLYYDDCVLAGGIIEKKL